MELKKIFNEKLTENGDSSFVSTLNPLLDLLFMTAYFEKHLNSAVIGQSDKEKLFSMFMRDPRFGLGRRDLGRRLMKLAGVTAVDIVKAGRFDDLFAVLPFEEAATYIKAECDKGNALAKKWCPRFGSKDKALASRLAHQWKMNKQTYGHFIKVNTAELLLSTKNVDAIEFDKLPSLALLKYWHSFNTREDTKARFEQYLESVKKGDAKMNVSTTTVYDIYRNREKIDPDLMFDKIEKISMSILPIVDVSGSMMSNDAIGKAVSIGHYLSLCSTYENGSFVTFSSRPELVSFKGLSYNDAIEKIKDADWGSSTDFGAVCNLLKQLDNENAPEWLCVLSDMEFNTGSRMSKEEIVQLFKDNGIKTKLIWWNFNARATTTPVTADENGNIFLSGYSPMLLKFLEVGFNAEQFLDKLLEEYKNTIE